MRVALRRATAFTASMLLAPVAGCGLHEFSSGDSFVGASLQERNASASYLRYYDSVTDLLGNTQIKIGSLASQALTEAVVVADIVGVKPDYGFTVSGAGAPDGTRVAYDDPDAEWVTVRVVADIDEIISGEASDLRIEIGFAFPAGTPFDRLAADFMHMPETVFFLVRSPVFTYDPLLYSVVDGYLYATVSEGGQLEFPSLSESDIQTLGAHGLTLSDLRNAAAGPPQVITVRPGQGR